MAYRDFNHLQGDRKAQQERRDMRGARLVGGSIAMRRLNGRPTELSGRWVYDPVFSDEHIAELRRWCDPSDPRPLVVEVGFQQGRFARAFCAARPDVRYMGFEVRRKFCQDADEWLVRGGVENARLALIDAREGLPLLLAPESLAALFAFFPDPWWKSKHMKKRLTTASFAADAAALLRDGGQLLIKSDVAGYADWAEGQLRAVPELRVRRLRDPAAGLPPTQRERRCDIHGRPTWAIEGVRRNRAV